MVQVWDPCSGLRYGRGQEMLRMHTCPLLTVGSLFNHRMVCANLQVGYPLPSQPYHGPQSCTPSRSPTRRRVASETYADVGDGNRVAGSCCRARDDGPCPAALVQAAVRRRS